MANPTRYPAGVGVLPTPHMLNTYPAVPSNTQIQRNDDFFPYRSGDYTSVVTGTGAAAAYTFNGGAASITNGGTAASNAFYYMGTSASLGTMQFIPGNQLWYDNRLAVPSGTMNGSTVTCTNAQILAGLFNSSTLNTATYAIYFNKPAGGSAVNLVINTPAGTTTFQNVADFSKPSGIFGDTSSVNGVLTTTGSGGNYTGIVVATAGSGYRSAPLVIADGATGANAQLYVQVGAYNGAVAPVGSGLAAPYIMNPGNAAYTTYLNDVIPFINLQMYYNGKGTIYIGVSGKTVLSLGVGGTNVAAVGGTYNVATLGNSFNFSTTTITTGLAPVQPQVGDAWLALPKTPLSPGFGMVGATTANMTFFVEELNTAVEAN